MHQQDIFVLVLYQMAGKAHNLRNSRGLTWSVGDSLDF